MINIRMTYVRPKLITELVALMRHDENLVRAMKQCPGTINPTDAERLGWVTWYRTLDTILRIIDEYRPELAVWKHKQRPKEETK